VPAVVPVVVIGVEDKEPGFPTVRVRRPDVVDGSRRAPVGGRAVLASRSISSWVIMLVGSSAMVYLPIRFILVQLFILMVSSSFQQNFLPWSVVGRNLVAVGTALRQGDSDRRPHRSQRAVLPHSLTTAIRTDDEPTRCRNNDDIRRRAWYVPCWTTSRGACTARMEDDVKQKFISLALVFVTGTFAAGACGGGTGTTAGTDAGSSTGPASSTEPAATRGGRRPAAAQMARRPAAARTARPPAAARTARPPAAARTARPPAAARHRWHGRHQRIDVHTNRRDRKYGPLLPERRRLPRQLRHWRVRLFPRRQPRGQDVQLPPGHVLRRDDGVRRRAVAASGCVTERTSRSAKARLGNRPMSSANIVNRHRLRNAATAVGAWPAPSSPRLRGGGQGSGVLDPSQVAGAFNGASPVKGRRYGLCTDDLTLQWGLPG
jgi:hypothetical protein